jgi:hypothetical protein
MSENLGEQATQPLITPEELAGLSREKVIEAHRLIYNWRDMLERFSYEKPSWFIVSSAISQILTQLVIEYDTDTDIESKLFYDKNNSKLVIATKYGKVILKWKYRGHQDVPQNLTYEITSEFLVTERMFANATLQPRTEVHEALVAQLTLDMCGSNFREMT